MPTHIRRFLSRFAIAAVIDTMLVLCLISAFRLWYVRDAATIAAKYADAGQHEQVVRSLRLAHRWAPAYPAFSEAIARLHEQALRQTDSTQAAPAPVERSFSADIPLPEKALIPADMLVNLLYRKYSERKAQQSEAESTAEAGTQELRPGPDEQAGREAINLHTPPLGGTSAHAGKDPRAAKPAYNPDVMWGSVRVANAPLFDRNGRKMRDIPAGSIVDVQETRSSSIGDVVIGSVRSRNGSFKDAVLRSDDVELYVGYPLSSASKEQIQLVSKQGEILAAIKSRKAELEAAAGNRNPHQTAYRDVLRQYKAIGDESNKLKEQYEKATGNTRMELGNKLRTLKNDQFVLMPKYQELKKKKEDWDRSNQSSAQDSANDPQIRQLNQQLQDIERQLGKG
jgi:hypothetical protein